MLKKIALSCLSLLTLAQTSQACTVWASIGTVNQNEQLLYIKNRDAPLNSFQQLQLITPPQGYRYLALMYKNVPTEATFSYVSAGINQAGLIIGDTDIHTGTPYSNAVAGATMRDILSHYDSVAAVLRDQKQLFSHGDDQSFLIADKHQVIVVEVAPEGQYAVFGPIDQGYIFHTNHYLDDALIRYNEPVSLSTFMRYNRIHALLSGATAPFEQSQFEAFAKDETVLKPDGSIDTNNNILRKVTLATWAVAIPKEGPPVLHLQELNPKQPKHDIRLTLTPAFWQQP